MKVAALKPLPKPVRSKRLEQFLVKGKRANKRTRLSKDPFFSSPPVDFDRTNNKIIDQILYGKNGS